MKVEEKIVEFLKSQNYPKKAEISQVKVSSTKNKDGNNLLIVRASILEENFGLNYSNSSIYYGFDMEGNYVGHVRVTVQNLITPSQVEMEYWANPQYENKGNITCLAKDVIKEIFEEKVFDNLKVREGRPLSNINSIMVAINDDNFASLTVAKKLGFNEGGLLYIDDYYKQIEKDSQRKL